MKKKNYPITFRLKKEREREKGIIKPFKFSTVEKKWFQPIGGPICELFLKLIFFEKILDILSNQIPNFF